MIRFLDWLLNGDIEEVLPTDIMMVVCAVIFIVIMGYVFH